MSLRSPPQTWTCFLHAAQVGRETGAHKGGGQPRPCIAVRPAHPEARSQEARQVLDRPTCCVRRHAWCQLRDVHLVQGLGIIVTTVEVG